MHFVSFRFCLLSSKLESSVRHCLWVKQHHDVISSSRNLETAGCIAWHSLWKLQYEDFWVFECKFKMRNRAQFKKICLALSLPSPTNLAVTVKLNEGIEKCTKNKGNKKGAWESSLLLTDREVCLYFLKTKNSYFPQNNIFQVKEILQNSGLAYFSLCLSKTLNKVAKITYIQITTIL